MEELSAMSERLANIEVFLWTWFLVATGRKHARLGKQYSDWEIVLNNVFQL